MAVALHLRMRFFYMSLILILGVFGHAIQPRAGVPDLVLRLSLGWAGPVHASMLEEAFPQASALCLKALQEGSAYTDQDQFQIGPHSHMHAMRAPGQSQEEAASAMRVFIENHFTLARQSPTQEQQCFYRGVALHPVMDSTSPAHHGFQEWDPLPFWSLAQALRELFKNPKALSKIPRMLEHGESLRFSGIRSKEDQEYLRDHPEELEKTLELMRQVDRIQFEVLRELELKAQ